MNLLFFLPQSFRAPTLNEHPRRRKIASARRRLQKAAQRRAWLEQLEDRRMLNVDWRNPVDALDVNGDGAVAPSDALAIINDINAFNSRALPAQHDPAKAFIDPNGDQFVAPNDAIAIINALNAGLVGNRGLSEGGQIASQTDVTVTVGQQAGNRTYRVQLNTVFDTTDQSAALEDVIAVYLVDPSNPSQTLLDRGTPGTALFTLAGNHADYVPGQVHWDGSVLQLDLTGISGHDTGLLRFQLISADGDSGTKTTIKPLTNSVDVEGQANATLTDSSAPAAPGPAVNVTSLVAAPNVDLQVANVRYSPSSGKFEADLSLHNGGTGLGRDAAVLFPGLPAGVTLPNASGTTATGTPYLNFHSAIAGGGLDQNATSDRIAVEFDDPSQLKFVLKPQILASTNHAPVLDPIGPLSVFPGGILKVPLHATDPDGDPVTFAIPAIDSLPAGMLKGDGSLVLRPTPSQIGSYAFDIIASDGSAEASQPVTLNVTADPVTTTRISGQVLQVSGQPLANMQVEVGSVTGLTGADGSFLLDLGSGPVVSDTIKIRGDLFAGAASYPFIAEKLPLLLEHDVYEHFNNVIDRSVFLPALDVANAKQIDPMQDTMVTTDAIPGASVLVKAGTLMDQQGTQFTGKLSITEVPIDLTPAALPENLRIAQIVTIQPGDMVFASPAPLTLPNTGYSPGTVMDLWSINPVTGQFDKVGTGKVSDDGAVINTVSGGIRNSSWHGYAIPVPPLPELPPPPENIAANNNDDCAVCRAAASVNSEVDFHSGAVTESHQLVTYQAVGGTFGLKLTYDSMRADPRPIVHEEYLGTTARSWFADPSKVILVGNLSLSRGTFSIEAPGNVGGSQGIVAGDNFWTIPSNPGPVEIALQADLRSQPSGKYDYAFSTGFFGYFPPPLNRYGGLVGNVSYGHVLMVNSVNSSFGSGWGLAGLQRIVENPDGTLLWIDGDGTEELFKPDYLHPGSYLSPAGDFSALKKLGDGTYQRTLTDQTVYSFNAHNDLTSVVDRNGRTTTYTYDGFAQLMSIADPVGLKTTFAYSGGKVTSITDPAGRITHLSYDSAGNLIQVVDPDGSNDQWQYDGDHHLTTAIDKRGNVGRDFYNFAGRATDFVRPDGSSQQIIPIEMVGLFPHDQTTSPVHPPLAVPPASAITTYADGNGNVTRATLDSRGQEVESVDAIGPLPKIERDANNLVTLSTDARGYTTSYQYDSSGNLLKAIDTPVRPTYTETGGQVVAEAEDFSDRSRLDQSWLHWPYEDSGTGAAFNNRGNGYLQALPVNRKVYTDPRSKNTPYVDYKVHISTVGTYQLYMHMAGLDSVSKSLYAQIVELHDGTGGAVADFYQFTTPNQQDFKSPVSWLGTAGFEKTNDAPVEGPATWQIITPGDYTLRVSMRQDGTFFDALVLQLTSLAAPTDDGPPSNIPPGSGQRAHEYAYDAKFNLVTSDANEAGHTTVYNLDPANGNVVTETHQFFGGGTSLDVVSHFTYTPLGLIDTATDPLGRLTHFDYDTRGRVTKITKAKGTADEGIVQYEYDAAGNVTAYIDEKGNRTTFTYDALNRLLTKTEPDPDGAGSALPPKTIYTYDAAGNVATAIDARGNVTHYEYDSLDRLLRSTDSASGVTAFTHDGVGNLTLVRDPLGHTTTYSYDARSRLVSTTDSTGGVTKYQYDLDNNPTAVIDPVGNQTTLTFDGRGRVSSQTDPLGATTSYAYAAGDNVASITDRDGRRRQFSYDDMDRLRYEDWYDSQGTLVDSLSFSYDKDSNVVGGFDGSIAVLASYDNRNRVSSTTNFLDPATTPAGLVYTYDAVGNRLSRSDFLVSTPEGTTNYVYDADSRLTRMTQTGGGLHDKRVDFTLDPNGEMTGTSRFSDLAGTQLVASSSMSYDTLNRLSSIAHQKSATSLASYNVTYDAAGRITQLVDKDGTSNYTYDARNELTSAMHTAVGLSGESYAYDATGNRTSAAGHTDTTGSGNRLLSDGTYNYTYDAEGNMLTRTEIATGKLREFQWDFRNRLTGVIDRNSAGGAIVQQVTFTYDAFDRRVSKTVAAGASITATYFVSDRNNVAFELYNDNAADLHHHPSIGTRYLFGPAVDQLLAQESASGAVLWALADNIGSVRDLVNSSGQVVNHIKYDSYGRLISQTDATQSSHYGYTGRELDTETGLQYNRARYYDAAIGRFLSQDPMGFGGGDSDLYRYVFNDPLKFTDPSGLATELIVRDVEGDVYYHKCGTPGGALLPVEKGAILKENDKIIPGPDGKAVLSYPTGDTFVVEGGPEHYVFEYFQKDPLTIKWQDKVRDEIWEKVTKPRLDSIPKSDFRIKEPTGTASVRG